MLVKGDLSRHSCLIQLVFNKPSAVLAWNQICPTCHAWRAAFCLFNTSDNSVSKAVFRRFGVRPTWPTNRYAVLNIRVIDTIALSIAFYFDKHLALNHCQPMKCY